MNGLVVIYKGPGAPEEFVAPRPAIEQLGGDTVRLAPVTVPFLDDTGFILLIRKIHPSPNNTHTARGWPASNLG